MSRRRRGSRGHGLSDHGAPHADQPSKTLFEISAGGVVYRRGEHGIEICLIATKGGTRWQLPKGKREPGEALEETAVREAAEETGITTRIGPALDKLDLWYTWREGGEPVRHHKLVYLYLLEFLHGRTADHDHEVDEARWFTAADALAHLTFASEGRAVKHALALLAAEGTATKKILRSSR